MELRRGIQRARKLRSAATDTEAALWRQLRGKYHGGFKFRRQFPISGYVVDFVCLEEMLVVELDGGQHTDQVEYDARRSEVLAKSGFRVIRFWNNDVLQKIEDVLAEILGHLQTPPSPRPSPASGRGG